MIWSSMQVISSLCSSSNTTREELPGHRRSIFLNLSGAPAGGGDQKLTEQQISPGLTIERTGDGVTDGDVVLISTTHSPLLETQRVVAAVLDVPDDVGRGGREGGEVAGGASVEPRDAAGEVDLPPVVSLASSLVNSSS